jgi:hypothetical protein
MLLNHRFYPQGWVAFGCCWLALSWLLLDVDWRHLFGFRAHNL